MSDSIERRYLDAMRLLYAQSLADEERRAARRRLFERHIRDGEVRRARRERDRLRGR